jgi:hypothetical protein
LKSLLIALGAASAMLAACTPQAPTAMAAVKDKFYTVTPEFPVAALKAKNLKEVRLKLAFIPSQFREETLNFTVSIGGQ